MGVDFIVDTNVLLVASHFDEISPFDEAEHVAVEDREKVFEWLAAFRKSPGEVLVLDEFFHIYDEYRHKLNSQDYGLQVIGEKMQTARFFPVEYDENGSAILPEDLKQIVHDLSDRKFVAVALALTLPLQ